MGNLLPSAGSELDGGENPMAPPCVWPVPLLENIEVSIMLQGGFEVKWRGKLVMEKYE